MWSGARIGLFRFEAEMKTREEFVAGVRAYRRKFQWWGSMFVLFLLGCFLLEAFSSKSIWYVYSFLGVVVFLWSGSKLRNYPSLIGLVCPECGHALKPGDLAGVFATRSIPKCPKCGNPFFA